MSKSVENKTSDEILNELFNSLNLPLSPLNSESSKKVTSLPDKERTPVVKSSYEDESDSNLSDGSTTDQEIDNILKITDVSEKKLDEEKLNSKKTHKKKKKKKVKKDGESRSKHKKKKKKKSKHEFLSDSEVEKSKEPNCIKDENISTSKYDTNTSVKEKTKKKNYSRSRSRSKSSNAHERKVSRSRSKSSTVQEKRVSRSTSKSPEFQEIKKSRSRSKSHKTHERSRSKSESKSKYSSKSKSGYYRSRSRTRSKSKIKYSSKSKSDHYRSRSRSRSYRNNGNGRKRDQSSISLSPSPRYNSKKYRSQSPSKKRKRSQSPPKVLEDPLDIWKKTKLASLQRNSDHKLKLNDDDKVLESVNTSNEENQESIPVKNIPLPVLGEANNTCANPSVIPLPDINKSDCKMTEGNLQLTSSELAKDSSICKKISDHTYLQKTQESSTRIQDKKDEGKAKTIVIKSLKDSIVFQQIEEAKRKTKDEESKNLKENEQDISVKKEGKLAESNVITAESNEADKSSKNLSINETKDAIEDGEIVDEEETEKKKDNLSEPLKKIKKKESKQKNAKSNKNNGEKKLTKSRERSRSKSRSKNRSRSKSHSKERKSSSSKNHSKKSKLKEKARRRSRSHSKSKKHSSLRNRDHKRSRSRSHSNTRRKRRKRSSSRSERSPDCVDSLRDKATRKRLLEVARKNAVYLMKNNCLPPVIEKESIKATGKTVEELTSFCKQLVSKEYSDDEMSDPSLSPDDQDMQFDKPFVAGRHPFAVKDSKPIMMNIRNAPMLPTKTNAERLADTSKLREQFPVSSGSQHRNVAESEWVPVEKEESKEKETTVFPEPQKNCLDISQLVSNRLSAMRRLQDNPSDKEAMKALTSSQKEMQNWALSKQIPGQFTGSTGARILSQEELSSGYQAWARKEQFKEANPVSSHFGMKMLQKMGWNPGEGLGKNKEGQIEPLLLDVKMDKKGLTAQEEMTPRRTPIPLAKSLSGKHPVSALVEICSKRKWGPPEFEIVFDGGPDHKKNFLMKVHVNNQTYKPAIAASTKKIAKANAAAACLQALGLIPKDPTQPQGTLNTSQTQTSPTPQGEIKSFSPPPLPPGVAQNPVSMIPHPLTTVQSQECIQNFMQQPMPYYPVTPQIPTMQPYVAPSSGGFPVPETSIHQFPTKPLESYQNAIPSYSPQSQVLYNIPHPPISSTAPPDISQPSVPGEEEILNVNEKVESTAANESTNIVPSSSAQPMPSEPEISSSTKDIEANTDTSSSCKPDPEATVSSSTEVQEASISKVSSGSEEPIMLTSTEEPIMLTSNEEPIMLTSNEEPIILTSNEEPIILTSNEEP